MKFELKSKREYETIFSFVKFLGYLSPDNSQSITKVAEIGHVYTTIRLLKAC